MPLQTTYRPNDFGSFIGNKDIVEALEVALEREDSPQVFAFFGIAGSGKTTMANILKNYFECADMDYYYYNSANTRGIDTIRDISVNCHLAPMGGSKKMYILDEFHQVTSSGQEAMLLLLENPPKDTIFIICTSEPEKLKLSIKRRCFQCNFKPLPEKEIITVLTNILKEEFEDAGDFPIEVLKAISTACQGSAGMAVSMLDAVVDMEDEAAQLSVIESMRGVNDTEGIDICRALMKRDWNTLSTLLSAFNGEPESLRYMILSYFSKILLGKQKGGHKNAVNIIMLFSDSFMYSKKAGLIATCYLACTS